MNNEKIQLQVRLHPEKQTHFVCDQHGRAIDGVISTEISTAAGSLAQANISAALYADGKKYTGCGGNNPTCNEGIRGSLSIRSEPVQVGRIVINSGLGEALEERKTLLSRIESLEAELARAHENMKAQVSVVVDDKTLEVMRLGYSVRIPVGGKKVVLVRGDGDVLSAEAFKTHK